MIYRMLIIPHEECFINLFRNCSLFCDKVKHKDYLTRSCHYDSDLDILYLQDITSEYGYSKKLSKGLCVTVGQDYNIIMLEVINASKTLNVSKKVLTNINKIKVNCIHTLNNYFIQFGFDSI